MPAISFLPFLQTVPVGTRILTALLAAGSLSALFLDYAVSTSVTSLYGLDIPWLVVVPGLSWKYPWTLLTAGFVELNIIQVSNAVHFYTSGTLFSCQVWLVARPGMSDRS